MIKLIADHSTEAEVTIISSGGNLFATVDSNARPNIIQSEPIMRYIAIIIMMLPVINVFAM